MTKTKTIYYDKPITVLVDEQTRDRFLELSSTYGLGMSAYLRRLINDAVNERQAEHSAV